MKKQSRKEEQNTNGRLTPCNRFMTKWYQNTQNQSNRSRRKNSMTTYVKYCQKYGIPHEKYDIFCKNVKNRFAQLKESRPEIKGQRVNCWKGVLWKGKEKLYDCPKCEYRNTDAFGRNNAP